jgi:phosphomevalonate kinase
MIIGLIGKKKSGKDTLFELLRGRAVSEGFPITRCAFADPLKQEVARACGVDLATIEKDKDRWRTILQWWGTEFRRHYNGEGYWLAKMRETLEAARHNSVIQVITDTRFPNEAKLIEDMGGILVRIERGICNVGDPHPSETALDGYPVTMKVYNNGTLEVLKIQADQILQTYVFAPGSKAA